MFEKQVIGNATLYRGDCVQVLQALPPVQFDALITDPPYSSGGMTRGDRTNQTTSAKYVTTGSAQDASHNEDFSGDNRDSRSWGFWVSYWLTLVQERMKPGGYALCFTDWRQLPMLTDAFQSGGLVWRGLVPWDKTESSRAPHTGYFRHQCEYIVWGSNGPLPVSSHGGPWPGLIRERVDHRKKLHMTGKPVHLMSELVKCVTPGGMILDAFMGSASTGVAAVQNGYHFIGIEKTTHYFDIACKRMEQVLAGDLLPGLAQQNQADFLTDVTPLTPDEIDEAEQDRGIPGAGHQKAVAA